MIRTFGKHTYTLCGVYTNKKSAEELVKLNRGMGGFYSRYTRDMIGPSNPMKPVYRVWLRKKSNK